MKIHCKYDALVPIRELKPYAKNRNKHPKEQIERLAKLIEYQGLRAPIVVGTNLNPVSQEETAPKVVKGHGTLEAIALLGETQAPIVYQDFENEDQRYAFVQSDNAIASWSELDLAGINADIGEMGPFDIDLLGIEGFTVDDRFSRWATKMRIGELEQLEQLQQLERLERLQLTGADCSELEQLLQLELTSLDYRAVEIKPNSVVYCDPPYAGTASYTQAI
jgi:hypothetical protein